MKTYVKKIVKCLEIIGIEYNSLTEETIKKNNTTLDEIDDKINRLQFIIKNIKEFENEGNVKLRSKAMKELYDITKYFIKLNDNKRHNKLYQI
jgi:hypothetical protein